MTLLLSMSLLPEDSLATVIEKVGKEGTLILAIFPHIRYDRAYAVISPEDFAERDRQALSPVGPGGFGEILTTEYLAPIRGPGPTFRGETQPNGSLAVMTHSRGPFVSPSPAWLVRITFGK